MENTTQLTLKEQVLLDAIKRGMDEPGCGWLDQLAPETLSTAGTLSSLVKKGLVVSTQCPPETPGYGAAYWVELSN